MGASRNTIPSALGGRGTRRYLLAGIVLALALVTLAVLLVLGVGGSGSAPKVASKTSAGVNPASVQAQGSSTATGQGAGATHPPAARLVPQSSTATGASSAVVGAAGQTAEIRDPEEARSYPAPASVQHSSANSPSAAGDEIAPGATSTDEVRKELAQMHAVESASRKQTLTPVKGGDSIGGNGTIPIPTNVPEVVQRVIAGANAIADFPYRFGGGHASFIDNAYDCSGSVSYALAAGGLLGAPETSGTLEGWGKAGPGRYITVYANAGHTYMYVNGVLYDTAGRSGVFASRWQVYPVDNSGYVVRHWPGL